MIFYMQNYIVNFIDYSQGNLRSFYFDCTYSKNINESMKEIDDIWNTLQK